jgi:hypothetical protein
MEYLHKFSTQAQCDAYVDGEEYKEPFTALITSTSGVNYNKIENPLEQPLTFKITSGSGYIAWILLPMGQIQEEPTGLTIEYKLNNGDWTEITSKTPTGETISDVDSKIAVNEGDILQFRGDNSAYTLMPLLNAFGNTSDVYFNVEGNIMSLIDSNNYANLTEIEEPYAFRAFFAFSTNLVSAENLLLPATTLSEGCYGDMFGDFMGKGNQLTTAPELPATTLAESCYQNMFAGCINLNYIKCLAEDISAEGCVERWTVGVSESGTFVKAPTMHDWSIGENGIPDGWVIEGLDALYINKNSEILPMSGGSFELNITSPVGSWTANTDNVWLSISQQTGGTGESTIEISAQSCSEIREGTITFTDGETNQVIKIEQDSKYFIPLTFNIISGGSIYWKTYNNYTNPKTIEYRINNGNWTEITSTTGGTEIQVNDGDTIQFLGNNNVCTDNSFSGSTAIFNAEGNIMSLKKKEDFYNLKKLNKTEGNDFSRLFFGCIGLASAENLLLPSTDLSSGCYNYMFGNCTNLTKGPELPATALASYCYAEMFSNCSSLTTAPELPATTLANSCYQSMFSYCFNLKTAPSVLPATTLADYCYQQMFFLCQALQRTPVLPATTLTNSCYSDMFSSCSLLRNITCLATNISANHCTYQWTSPGIFSYTGNTFVKHPSMNNWEIDSVNGIPSGWTVEDYSVEFSEAEKYMPESGGSFNLTVSCYVSDWSATTQDSWISLDEYSGDYGETVITVSLQQAQEPRKGSIIFTNAYGISKEFIIRQTDDYFTPLTFNIISGGSIYWKFEENQQGFSADTIEYRINNGNWTEITATTGGTEIIVNSGDNVQFRGENSIYWRNSFSGTNATFDFEGNIMSMFYGDDFIGKEKFPTDPNNSNNGPRSMFNYCTFAINGNKLVLPATTLSSVCYSNMFDSCINLRTAPELKAVSLASNCYSNMFQRCKSLLTAPELPATVLAYDCYTYMFNGCASLTTAPALPATELKAYCYEGMFFGCSGLTSAPELPATTLANYCYYQMFYNCSSLNRIKCLATEISATDCTKDWVKNVASSGTFVKNPNMSDWTTGVNGIPTNWTVQDAS